MRNTIFVALTMLMLAVRGETLLKPLWSTTLMSSVVPPTDVVLGWSLFVEDGSWGGSGGYFITTTTDHILCVLNASAGGELAWAFSDWDDNATPAQAYGRSLASGTNTTNGDLVLHVLRGASLYVFNLATGLIVASNTVSFEGELPTSLSSVTPALLLLQYDSFISVVDAGTGVVKWSQAVMPEKDVRTGMNGAPYVAVVERGTAGALTLAVLAAADGHAVFRKDFVAATMRFFYVAVVDATSVTYIATQDGVADGKEQACRYFLNGTEVFCVAVEGTMWGYGVAGGYMYLQLSQGEGLSISIYDYATGTFTASTGLIPQTVNGEGHLVGEPEYALLAFVRDQTEFHLTGWRATNGTNVYNFTFANAGKTTFSTHRPQPKHLRYSAAANVMMANWNGQVFVPDATGFHYVDGNRAVKDDTYSNSFDALVFPATALTESLLVMTSGSTVHAFQLL